MPRLRDLGVTPGVLPTGRHNAITDVAGVLVGQVTLIAGEGPLHPGYGPIRTGATAILPHGGNLFQEKVVAAVQTFNGFGKAMGFEQVRELGTIETPILLTNTLNVPRVADAVIDYMLARNPDIGLTAGTVNPVVGECNDGFLNDIRGRHVRAEHVLAALQHASDGPVAEGAVGAGTGTACFGFKGGIGTASRLTPAGYTLGTLVQSNFGSRQHLQVLGIPVGQHFQDRLLPLTSPPPGSVMIVLATDAPLTARQLGRLASRAALGLARTGAISASGSGDFVIAFSTANRRPHRPAQDTHTLRAIAEEGQVAIDDLFLAVVESVEEAVLNSLTAATTMTGRDGHTLYALPPDELVDLLRRYGRAAG